MQLVQKKNLVVNGAGPIARGETPQQAAERMDRIFGHTSIKYAFRTHSRALVGKNQQFPVIIGTVWTEKETK